MDQAAPRIITIIDILIIDTIIIRGSIVPVGPRGPVDRVGSNILVVPVGWVVVILGAVRSERKMRFAQIGMDARMAHVAARVMVRAVVALIRRRPSEPLRPAPLRLFWFSGPDNRNIRPRASQALRDLTAHEDPPPARCSGTWRPKQG